jgi:hypothetical protein
VTKVATPFNKSTRRLNITSGFREVIFAENYLDGACKAESLNLCYVFFLQEKIAEGDSMTQDFPDTFIFIEKLRVLL